MTDFIPPTAHEEIDFLEEVEREMMVLTTADLEELTLPMSTLPSTLKTVIQAEAGTYSTQAVNDENIVAATPRGYGPRPAPG